MQTVKDEEEPSGLVPAGISCLLSGLDTSQPRSIKPTCRGLSQQRDNRC